MSFTLPPVDLTNLPVGHVGQIPLQNMGISAGGVSANPAGIDTPAYIFFHNDSGAGLQLMKHDEASSLNLPAGAWAPISLSPGESRIDFLILYLLPKPPVSLLLMTYYAPGEPLPPLVLGNSPVGIGGTVSTSGNVLTNETNTPNFETIDIGTIANQKLIDIFNDHFIWQVEQAGVRHQVLKGNIAGNPLQIGQASDVSEVLGTLAIDGPLQPNFVPIVVNGSTSGTASIYQWMQGTLKTTWILYVNFRNAGGAINQLIPVPYTNMCQFHSDGIPGVQLAKNGVGPLNCNIVTALAVGGGTQTGSSTIFQFSWGLCKGNWDMLTFSGGNTLTSNGMITIEGI